MSTSEPRDVLGKRAAIITEGFLCRGCLLRNQKETIVPPWLLFPPDQWGGIKGVAGHDGVKVHSKEDTLGLLNDFHTISEGAFIEKRSMNGVEEKIQYCSLAKERFADLQPNAALSRTPIKAQPCLYSVTRICFHDGVWNCIYCYDQVQCIPLNCVR